MTEPAREMTLVSAASVHTRPVRWLIDPWIPRGSLTLLAGREGLGKSTVACDLAAQATRGELDNAMPLRVLYLHTEDSREMTVKPRLEAAGADLAQIAFLDVTVDGNTGALSLPFDYPALRELIASNRIGLIILDAAKSAMSSMLNDHRDDDVRRFLEPAARIADDLDCVFLALVHFGKRQSADTGQLILGSIAWSQVARSVLSVARDEESGDLIVTNTKGNLASREYSREARIVSAAVPDGDGGTTLVGRIEWGNQSTRSVRDLLAADGADDDRSEIQAVVLDYLESVGGSAPAGDVLKVTRAAGLTDNAVKKARKRIGVATERQGFGPGSRWVWTIDRPAIETPIDAIDTRACAREPMESMPIDGEPMPTGAGEAELW